MIPFTAANNAVSVTARDVITSAMREIGALAVGEVPTGDDASWGLEKLQRLVDGFNARREVIFSHTFQLFTLLPNHAPHTIGPSGDFNVAIRPVKILSASFILNSGSSNPVDLPINTERNDQWWAANPLKSQASSIVTDLYYDPSGPLGTLNFWPIANISNPVRLEYWNALAQPIDLNSTLGFVQGYWDAIVLTLALRLAPSHYVPAETLQSIAALQQQAMRVILANNDEPPRIDLTGGMPSAQRSGRPDFNFLTGLRE